MSESLKIYCQKCKSITDVYLTSDGEWSLGDELGPDLINCKFCYSDIEIIRGNLSFYLISDIIFPETVVGKEEVSWEEASNWFHDRSNKNEAFRILNANLVHYYVGEGEDGRLGFDSGTDMLIPCIDYVYKDIIKTLIMFEIEFQCSWIGSFSYWGGTNNDFDFRAPYFEPIR